MFAEFFTEYINNITLYLQELDSQLVKRVIEILIDAYKDDHQIFVIGNGGSASSANHFTCDFGKNAIQQPDKRRFRIISLCDNIEKLTAFANDIDYSEVFNQQLINLMNKGDVLIAISASGNSPNILRACEYAKNNNGRIIAFTGTKKGKINQFSEVSINIQSPMIEQIEDIHLIILHILVAYFKNNIELIQ